MPARVAIHANGARRNRAPEVIQTTQATELILAWKVCYHERRYMNRGPQPPADMRVCHLGTLPYLNALAIQAEVQAQRQADEAARHSAPAGAPTRLHTRPPRRGQRAVPRRGLLPCARHRDRANRPWRQGHLPRPRPARRLPDHARRRHQRAPAQDGGGDRGGACRVRHRGALTLRGGHRLHRRVGGESQDRLDRRARLARRVHTWLCRQRHQRPHPVHMDRALRPSRCDHDIGRTGARPRAGRRHRLIRRARRTLLLRGT